MHFSLHALLLVSVTLGVLTTYADAGSQCRVTNCLACPTAVNKCTKCATGYEAKNGVCVNKKPTDKNCLRYDTTGRCTTCATGYEARNGVCVNKKPTDKNCLRYDTTGRCTTCATGYYVEGNKCVPLKNAGASPTSAVVAVGALVATAVFYAL